MGRPSSYNDETADLICEKLIEGESLRSICLSDDMPNASTVCRWLRSNEAFRQQYALAREAQADTLADEMLDIADDGSNDWLEKHGDEGENLGWRENGEAIGRSRLRLDTRKWIASKLKPKVYGDKLDMTSGGEKLTDQADITSMAVKAAAMIRQALERDESE